MCTGGSNFYFSSIFIVYVLSNALFKIRVLHYGIRAVRAYRTVSHVCLEVIRFRKESVVSVSLSFLSSFDELLR